MNTLSVIVPIYNEEKTIADCIASLTQQIIPAETIVVDDGSTDNSASVLEKLQVKNLQFLKQSHRGSGSARNLGVKHASGTILVFVDADMTFAPDFLSNLTEPIISGRAKGTFSKEEYVANWDNPWSRCWNYNENLADNRRIPRSYPDESPVFRAILKSEFDRVGGFDNSGFTDDWTLSRKLGYLACTASHAVCFHRNPDSLHEVFLQARWIGKSEFYTGSVVRKLRRLFFHFLPVSVILGLLMAARFREGKMVIFKIIYDLAIEMSVVLSFFGEKKYK